jgi:hypothetical protein
MLACFLRMSYEAVSIVLNHLQQVNLQALSYKKQRIPEHFTLLNRKLDSVYTIEQAVDLLVAPF